MASDDTKPSFTLTYNKPTAKKIEYEDEDDDIEQETCGGGFDEQETMKKKTTLAAANGRVAPPCCQVENCGVDLTNERYYRRHKVCQVHAKAPVVIVAGTRQRFCQQCSRQKNKCYFPSMPIQDDELELEFEFGSVTSPCSPNSPADHFFLNGRLLPHYFPCPPAKHRSIFSRSTSRTSSFSSKDSLESSRSNSISSMNSSCSSSARTSTSDGFDRKILINGRTKSASTPPVASKRLYPASRPVLMPQYGSQRWQFIAPAPVLSRKVSRRNRAESEVQEAAKAKKGVEGKRNGSVGFFRRFFCWFVSACNECHAIKPSMRETVFEGKIESR